MTLADVARACVPSPSDASSSEESSFDDFASATFDRLRALRDGARDLEPARPRQRIPNDRDDGSPRAAPLVEEVSSSSSSAPTRTSSALALLACAAHGARAAGDVPRWSNARLRALADSTYDDGFKARGPDAVIDSFLEAHSWEEPPSKASFGADAASDALAAEIAARQLSWCLERDELYRGSRTRDVVAVAMPRVLRALDYPSEAVRASGAMSARALSTRATGFDWRADRWGAVLLDACRSALIGATPEVWPHALDVACALTGVVAKDAGIEEYRKTFARAIDCARLRGTETAYAAPLLASFPDLIRDAKACVAVHLDRLLPLLCAYMQSHRDDVAVGAASLVAIVVENAWPRARAHCESMWPHVKRAYAEADGRSAASCDKLRAELERVVELVQLAAGGEFTRVWKSDEDVPAHAVGLVRFLAARPPTVTKL
ncbi:hypothetical protein N9D08_01650 [bacterium]|nr:hypothetical protein [bacterium]